MAIRCVHRILTLPAAMLALSFVGLSLRALAQSWSLNNGVVSKKLSFIKGNGLQATSWKDLTTHYEFIRPGLSDDRCYEFEFEANHHRVSGRATEVAFTGVSLGSRPDGTSTLDMTFAAKSVAVKVILHYELGKNQPAIRQYLDVVNTGETPVVLKHFTISCGFIPPGTGRDDIAFGGYGEQPRALYFTGRVDDVLVREENSRTGIGWAVLSEVPGYERRTEVGQEGQWTPSFAAMYDTDIFPFQRSLMPGEDFRSAGVSVLFYQSGTKADPHWRIPRYVLSRIAHHNSQAPPDWIYNTWEPWRGKFGASQANDIIDLAHQNGFTLFTLDEGWQARLGDNEPDRTKFPAGLEPIFDRVSSLGMRRGLWMSVSLIDVHARDYVEHPEWACRDRTGRPRLSQGQGVVMCLASPYKYAVLKRVSEAVRKYRLNYIKLDLTTVFNTYGEEPGCYEDGHEHKSPQESMERIYEALGWLANSLHHNFPHLLIDYTFELWGQKHLIDYGLLRVADLDWLSNIADQTRQSPGPLQARMLLDQRGMAIPTESMLIGNLQAETPDWQEHVATEMGSGPLFLGNLNQQSEADRQHYKRWIQRFTQLRKAVRLDESFFPLGNWRQIRADRWDGFARVAHTGQGLIALFRNDSMASYATVAIPGFPDGSYSLARWDSTQREIVSGSALRKGLAFKFSTQQKSMLIEVRRVTPPELPPRFSPGK